MVSDINRGLFVLKPDLAAVPECSDGLDKEVDPEEIASVVAHGEGPPFSDTLVELALSRGSRDNVTVVTIEMLDADDDGDGEDTIPGLAG